MEEEEEKQAQYEALQIDRFGFFIWSKEKFSEDLDEDALLAAFQKRYAKSLPLQHINLIHVNDVADKSPVEPEEPEA